MNRVWAMPNKNTFDIPPIGEFVKKYLRDASVSIDPFARNKRWATYTNDLNTNTQAEFHLDVYDFLLKMKDDGVRPDLVIFDPPYSPRQVKECYDSIGLEMGIEGGQRPARWTKEKDLINEITDVGAIVLSFGWNSQGMGKTRGWETLEILLVCHGAGHNDTICKAEEKIAHQLRLDTESEKE
jgi:hypothetical protein